MTPGKEGITAHIIKDSISEHGIRITTMELEYPRFILAELNTHRMLSKNSASSRAIPIAKMNEMIREVPAMPVWWGKNQAGMSAREELVDKMEVTQQWKNASISMLQVATYLSDLGLHKQITNRITEPWQRMKTVITGTEWDNLLWLRDHEDAQPEFAELAKCIRYELEDSDPELMYTGQWHLPYVSNHDINHLGIPTALKVSSSCCAQVSYRKLDDSLEKAIDIYDKLVGADRKHLSPFEHQARVMEFAQEPSVSNLEIGVSHVDRDGFCWSGNLRGFVQHRKLIEWSEKF